MVYDTSAQSDNGQGTVAAPGSTTPDKPASLSETESRVAQISSLLSSLEEAASESGLSSGQRSGDEASAQRHENRLVQVRLGVANGLFAALFHRHPQTAAHSLRVALGCSTWALFANMDEETHDTLELAALMHDLGKIGVPDAILLKPGRLGSEERLVINRYRTAGIEILSSCCGSQRLLDAVRYAGNRFDGRDSDLPAKGKEIPLEARMVTIVDAFDSMTTDQVHRSAMPRERALKELFESAGTQFDPDLVKEFVDVLSQRQDIFSNLVVSRWLRELSSDEPHLPWHEPTSTPESSDPATAPQPMFERKLIEAMQDGVVFVDPQAKICLWNRGAQRLTGVSSGAATGHCLTPSLLELSDLEGRRISDDDCPVAKVLETRTQVRRRLLIMGRLGSPLAVDLHAVPVQSEDGTLHGATVVLHNAESEASLELKCEELHVETTKDPLTRVANRAEFDRMLALFIESHSKSELPCSLIMLDIDRFKNINDTYGHQAGDEAIITLANLLSGMSRSDDLVARYGGEEFVVLCADCDNPDAARRAEQFRRKLSQIQHACLGNRNFTASFGVTELQAGDTPESMLRRADRAMLMAKEQGRNQVVQLGNGMEKVAPKKRWWNFARFSSKPVMEVSLTTAVPIHVAIEKLRGFVSDHQAIVIATHGSRAELEISSEHISNDRRRGDRHVAFRVELDFYERQVERSSGGGLSSHKYTQTCIDLKVCPKQARSRRKADLAERARLVVRSIKAYLMAEEELAPNVSTTPQTDEQE